MGGSVASQHGQRRIASIALLGGWAGHGGAMHPLPVAIAVSAALAPGLAIFVVVMGFNVLGDALRDLLDPRLRRGRY